MPSLPLRQIALLSVAALALVACADSRSTIKHSDPVTDFDVTQPVPRLDEAAEDPKNLLELKKISPERRTPGEGVPQVRLSALEKAGFSYGARGGLAHRSWQIDEALKADARRYDQLFNFGPLLIDIEDGGYVLPPVVAEGRRAFEMDGAGAAMSTRRAYRIATAAHISSVAPTWRSYLFQGWSVASEPPPDLRPNTEEEWLLWLRVIEDGWTAGLEQANYNFEDALARLTRDYKGMTLYHELVEKKVVRELFVAVTDKDVLGEDGIIRIGNKLIRITAAATFENDLEKWQAIILPEDRTAKR